MKKKKISRYVKFARLALRMCAQKLAPYTHSNSPKTYTQPQLVAACLLGFYLNLSYRDLEECLLASDKVCRAPGLEDVPDHSTLCRAYQRLRQVDLRNLNHWLMQVLAVETTWVAVDATGYMLTQASQHYRSRTGRKMSYYWQGFYAVDLTPFAPGNLCVNVVKSLSKPLFTIYINDRLLELRNRAEETDKT